MKKSKIIPLFVGLAIAGGVGAGYVGVAPAHAASSDSVPMVKHANHVMGVRPGVVGVVSSVSGSTLTLNSKNPKDKTTTTYTVDASSAIIKKAGASSTVSSIVVGDKVFVKGTVNGTNISATRILDGHLVGPKGKFHHFDGKDGKKHPKPVVDPAVVH